MRRGEIWWANLPDPHGSTPGYRRPVLILQADAFTASRIATVIVAVVTTNLRLATAPGNVLVPADAVGLPRDSVVNVSQIITINKTDIDQFVGALPTPLLDRVSRGVRLVLDV